MKKAIIEENIYKHYKPPNSWSNVEIIEQTRGKLLNDLGLIYLLHVSNLDTGPACGLLSLNQSTCLLLFFSITV